MNNPWCLRSFVSLKCLKCECCSSFWRAWRGSTYLCQTSSTVAQNPLKTHQWAAELDVPSTKTRCSILCVKCVSVLGLKLLLMKLQGEEQPAQVKLKASSEVWFVLCIMSSDEQHKIVAQDRDLNWKNQVRQYLNRHNNILNLRVVERTRLVGCSKHIEKPNTDHLWICFPHILQAQNGSL